MTINVFMVTSFRKPIANAQAESKLFNLHEVIVVSKPI